MKEEKLINKVLNSVAMALAVGLTTDVIETIVSNLIDNMKSKKSKEISEDLRYIITVPNDLLFIDVLHHIENETVQMLLVAKDVNNFYKIPKRLCKKNAEILYAKLVYGVSVTEDMKKIKVR